MTVSPLPPGHNEGPPSGAGERRTASRRRQDRDLQRFQQNYARKLEALQELGQLISLDLEVDLLLLQLAEKTARVVQADRCSVFLYDRQRNELWSTAATGLDGAVIRMPASSGLAGACFQTAEIINLEDAYGDPRFNPEPDSRTGYRTRGLLCLPIFGRDRSVLGVMQLLNKREGPFSREDIDFLQTFVNHAAVYLEMAQLRQARLEALEQSQEELRSLNRAKDKALNHLSHELRTPLSVIQGNLRLLERRLAADPPQPIKGEIFAGLDKNLERLVEIQQEAEKIVRSHQRLEDRRLLEILHERMDRWRRRQEISPQLFHQWQVIQSWLSGRLQETPGLRKPRPLYPVILEQVDRVRERAADRELALVVEGDRTIAGPVEERVLRETLWGLLKNAVENTPDGGRVRVFLRQEGREVVLGVEDTGVGITPENQKYLFDGLFPTQETDLYTSKKPFAFNAGGKGLDLLRCKLFGQCYGFRLAFETRRCRHLPRNEDPCPGSIAGCPYCRVPEDCADSGGTVFTLIFEGAEPQRDGSFASGSEKGNK
jgi:signal transduction histidine kinase